MLLTVPNNTEFEMLKRANLTYEHMLEEDHSNFFTKDSLSGLLSRDVLRDFSSKRRACGCPKPPAVVSAKGCFSGDEAGLVRPKVYYRLYAECMV